MLKVSHPDGYQTQVFTSGTWVLLELQANVALLHMLCIPDKRGNVLSLEILREKRNISKCFELLRRYQGISIFEVIEV